MASIRLPATLSSILAFQEHVCSVTSEVAPDANTGMLEMALEELLVNVVNYAYPDKTGEIELKVEAQNDTVHIAIIDTGIAYDPTETAPPDLDAELEDRPIGGLGVFLAQKVFATMNYRRDENKNILDLSFVPPPSV